MKAFVRFIPMFQLISTEIEDESSQIVSDLPLINEEIAARDPYLKSLFKNHPVKTDNEIIFSPLLFKNA